jgi:uncharacterized protein (DUF1501 family)
MTNRRVFLKGSALAIFGLGAAPAWLSRSVYASETTSGKRKKVLVAVFQRGAVDGLNVIVPFGEKRYYDLRPSLAIPAKAVVDLNGFFGFHPALIETDVGLAEPGDCRCGRLARSDALSF